MALVGCQTGSAMFPGFVGQYRASTEIMTPSPPYCFPLFLARALVRLYVCSGTWFERWYEGCLANLVHCQIWCQDERGSHARRVSMMAHEMLDTVEWDILTKVTCSTCRRHVVPWPVVHDRVSVRRA